LPPPETEARNVNDAGAVSIESVVGEVMVTTGAAATVVTTAPPQTARSRENNITGRRAALRNFTPVYRRREARA